ncbi:hypothetical protein G9A89_014491 [Geosiphon pyriformis]|nr:hypothetical protein G9A89_014491 [Geosiphon pyriformis]
MKATASSSISKKKTPKSAFHGPAGDSFSQKKKVVIGNIKHFGNEKDISLSKSGPGDSIYSDVDSISGNDKDVASKWVNTGAVFGSPLGSPNFYMDNDKVIDPKIIKTPMKVLVKKLFVLDINLSAVKEKSAMAKTQLIKKIFSSESLIKAILLAKEKGIIVNSNLKKQEICSDWAVVIKKILINMPKEIIIIIVSEFGYIKSIKIQLIRIWQKAVAEFAELEQAKQLASR